MIRGTQHRQVRTACILRSCPHVAGFVAFIYCFCSQPLPSTPSSVSIWHLGWLVVSQDSWGFMHFRLWAPWGLDIISKHCSLMNVHVSLGEENEPNHSVECTHTHITEVA